MDAKYKCGKIALRTAILAVATLTMILAARPLDVLVEPYGDETQTAASRDFPEAAPVVGYA